MVRIRMQRFGRHSRPFYRIAAIEKRVRRDGPGLENLGFYDPMEKDPAKALRLNADRIKHWLSTGAQPTDTVRDIFVKAGLMDKDTWEKERAHDRARVAKKLAEAPAKEEATKA